MTFSIDCNSYHFKNLEYPQKREHSDHFTIQFSDGQMLCYPIEFLSKIEFFNLIFQSGMSENKEQHINLEDFTLIQFQNVLALAQENKSPCEVYTVEELSTNPHIIDNIFDSISFFFPSESKNLMRKISKQFEFLPYSTYVDVLQTYNREKTESCEKEAEEIPEFVKIAESILIECCSFFDPERTLQEKMTYRKEIYEIQEKIEANEQTICSRSCSEFLRNELLKINESLALLKRGIEYDLSTKFSYQERQALGWHRLIELSKTDLCTARIAKEANNAQIKLEQYTENVKRLTYASEELMAYLTGPKAYLIEHFELIPDNDCFRLKDREGRCDVFLCGYSPYWAEKRLSQIVNNSYNQVVETIECDEEVSEQKNKLCQILINWNTCSDEEVVIIKEFLIKRSNLTGTTKPDDLRVSAGFASDTYTGKLTSGDQITEFVFHINEWKIRRKSDYAPVTKSTSQPFALR